MERFSQNKNQLMRILEESLNEIYMFDGDTLNFIYVNKGGLSNIGYSMDEMSEMTPIDIKPDFNYEEYNQLLEPLRNGKKNKIILETQLVRADDTKYPVEAHLQYVPSANVFIAIKLDITDRLKMESEKENLRRLVEESLNEIYIFDAETFKFTYVNKGALANIGYSMDEMMEMTPLDIKPEYNYQSFQELVKPLVDKRKKKIVFETKHKRADGSLYDVEVHLQLAQTTDVPTYTAIILDITNRKMVENKLLQLNQNLENKVEERTASLISYQNQLRSLAFQLTKAKENERKQLASFLHDNLGQVLAIGKMELDGLKGKDVSNDVQSGMDRISVLLNDAIKYTRELMADLMPAPSGEDDSLLSSIKWVAQKMEKYGLEVEIRDDGKPKPLPEENKSFILQAVKELLFNIVKHAGVNKAEIELTRKPDAVQVSIIDEGSGFNKEEKNFEPSKMAGFGLFNLQEQMEWLHGNLEIISDPGKGTTVNLSFSLNEEELVAYDHKAAEIEKPSQRPSTEKTEIRVLIADDHQMMREGLRKMISDQDDMTVIAEASNGKEAVDLARKLTPDVIIMDINMPEMDGIEATQKIANENSDVRIIGLSFHQDESVSQAILSAGASNYLSKSDVFESLCATVRSEGMILGT